LIDFGDINWQSLKFASCWGGCGERSCPTSAAAIHSVARGSNTQPSIWEADTLPLSYRWAFPISYAALLRLLWKLWNCWMHMMLVRILATPDFTTMLCVKFWLERNTGFPHIFENHFPYFFNTFSILY